MSAGLCSARSSWGHCGVLLRGDSRPERIQTELADPVLYVCEIQCVRFHRDDVGDVLELPVGFASPRPVEFRNDRVLRTGDVQEGAGERYFDSAAKLRLLEWACLRNDQICFPHRSHLDD